MGDTLLLEVIDGALRPLDRAVQEHAPERHAPTLTADEVEQIVRVCSLVSQTVAGQRQLTERFTAHGMERRQFAGRFRELLNSVGRARGSLSAALDLVRREGTSDATARLQSFLREVEEYQQQLVTVLAWAAAPTAPLPAELLRELEQPAPDRNYVSLDDFRAELRAGDG